MLPWWGKILLMLFIFSPGIILVLIHDIPIEWRRWKARRGGR